MEQQSWTDCGLIMKPRASIAVSTRPANTHVTYMIPKRPYDASCHAKEHRKIIKMCVNACSKSPFLTCRNGDKVWNHRRYKRKKYINKQRWCERHNFSINQRSGARPNHVPNFKVEGTVHSVFFGSENIRQMLSHIDRIWFKLLQDSNLN